ncbi:S1 RNA-binding domain-containing protein [Macrococcoides caseolyticum]|nr:S1-like domain-containing RNA-binding protein [Macrococcus caseolyticus]MDJ1088436.1 S1-like domain-containing RNA-binding protein [Macrococcus caseolyticus]MDJ1091119.1 S1-like domain-containing RNA-binding protein [Macrococcus caseolyticus]MDJ1109777.1 S1-like domain-containing RNA-binding protein [Macrococcus caseolyticus]MDJ1153731.1 S1-like domain-containing RNA-binding protein [Macrococcus caseolyticus]MDJ1154789.1 S1-like domain-containing RNA-binding protein [Macrococcus caseolyticu
MEQKQLSGSIDFLRVDRLEGSTYYLLGPNSEEVKLNASEVLEDDELEIGEDYSFFVYPGRTGDLFATQNIPDISTDRYDWVKVIKKDRDGVTVDIGIPREIVIPWEDLPKLKEVWPEAGDEVFACLRVDRNDQLYGRLASETIVDTMYTAAPETLLHTTITAHPYRLLRVGTFLLSKEGYKIFVHESERRSEPRLGEAVEVRIIGHKEDGTLNGSFLPLAHERMDDDSEMILTMLNEYGGELPFSDKSDPEAIKDVFNMSKGSFKRAIGRLYKSKRITIEPDKIKLNQ